MSAPSVFGPRRPPMVTLQWLRALAAMLVVATHLFDRLFKHTTTFGGWADIPNIGRFGVTMFFVISGFIMVLTTTTSFGVEGAPQLFIKRRLQRIVPLYYAFTIAQAIKVTLFDSRTISPQELFLSFLFIPYRNQSGLMQPFYALGWTLNYEMYFYGVLALSLYWKRPIGIYVCFAAILAVCGLSFALPFPSDNPIIEAVAYLGDGIVVFFLLGMGIGLVSITYPALLPRLSLAVSVPLATMAVFIGLWLTFSPLLMGLSCVCAVMISSWEAAQWNKSRMAKLLLYLGDSSYSVYLTHGFVLSPVFALALKFSLTNMHQLAILTLISIILCLAVGGIVHTIFEVPMNMLVKRNRVVCP